MSVPVMPKPLYDRGNVAGPKSQAPIDGGGIMSGLRRSSELSVVYGGVISPGSMPLDDDASKIGGGGGGGVDGGGGNPIPGGGGGSPTGQARSNEDRW